MAAPTVHKCELPEIADLREQFLKEAGFQFIHNKCHLYGWADVYLFTDNGSKIGYGAVWGKDDRQLRDTIFEFFLIPAHRHQASPIFNRFVQVCQAPFIECQTNDSLLAAMMFEHAEDIHAQSILFEDGLKTSMHRDGVNFGRQPYETNHPDERGGYVLRKDGEVVATGGFFLNYNYPYADIYMDVPEPYRNQGFGSFIVQELKKEIYKSGRVPAARCNIKNVISRATLIKAGFQLCGYLLEGSIRPPKAGLQLPEN